MLTLRNQAVRVSRRLLIVELEKNFALYKESYAEALRDYQATAQKFTRDALRAIELDNDYSNIHFKLKPPVDHTQDYADVLGMLGVSIDNDIELDREAYNAYFQNKWPWTTAFAESANIYKAFLQ